MLLYEDGEYYDAAVYQVFDAISIELASTQSDEVDPVRVDWSLVNFDG